MSIDILIKNHPANVQVHSLFSSIRLVSISSVSIVVRIFSSCYPCSTFVGTHRTMTLVMTFHSAKMTCNVPVELSICASKKASARLGVDLTELESEAMSHMVATEDYERPDFC